MFCVECGEEKPIFRDGSCLQCYLKNHQFTDGPVVIDITVCNHCGAFKYKNTWSNDSFETVLKRYVKQLFDISKELNEPSILLDCKKKKEFISCVVTITGFIDDTQISEEHNIKVRLHPNVCDICSKRFGGYHEAIVQIRPSDKKLKQDQRNQIQRFVEDLIFSIQKKGNRKLFIADMGQEHGGLDFYLSDKQAAFSITKQTQERFGGEITISSKNVGMKDSKQVYRMTYLLRLYPFHAHEFMVKNDRLFWINSLSNNMVHVIDLETWEMQAIEAKDLGNVTVFSYDDLVKMMIVVSQTEEDVQVMDEKTYKMYVVSKPQPVHIDDEKIPVVELNQNYFLFPQINNK
ncbi:MAG: NMD3-related protein [Thermoplasmatota archaeon]